MAIGRVRKSETPRIDRRDNLINGTVVDRGSMWGVHPRVFVGVDAPDFRVPRKIDSVTSLGLMAAEDRCSM